MKVNSNNFRTSAIYDIIAKLKDKGITVIIYEPTIDADIFESFQIVNNLEEFKK